MDRAGVDKNPQQGSLLTNVAEFESKIPALLELRGPHVVFFTADPDPTTGRPWCPDCARSEGAIREEVETSGGSLLEVQVGPREVWKDPSHPLRQQPGLNITGVPTVVLWTKDGPGDRLVSDLEKAPTADEARRLLKTFLG